VRQPLFQFLDCACVGPLDHHRTGTFLKPVAFNVLPVLAPFVGGGGLHVRDAILELEQASVNKRVDESFIRQLANIGCQVFRVAACDDDQFLL